MVKFHTVLLKIGFYTSFSKHRYKKNFYNIILLSLIFIIWFNNNLSASEIRIKQILLDNYPHSSSSKNIWGYTNYSKLDENGLPQDFELLFPYYSISFKLSIIGTPKLILRNKLENYDKNWTKCDTNQSSTYFNLQNGKYTYRVQGLNQGKIIYEKKFNFEIDKNYREFVWFDLFQLLLSLLCIFATTKIK
jgi:hypothetical protein